MPYPEIILNTSNIKEIFKLCRKRLEKDQNDYEALFALAYYEPDLKNQIKLIDDVLSINPNHAKSLYRQARNFKLMANYAVESKIKREFFKQSIGYYKRVMKLERDNEYLIEEYKSVVESLNKLK